MTATNPAPAQSMPSHPSYRTLWLLLTLFALHRVLVQALWGHDFYMDEAQYWSWAQRLDWGYYSKPPLIAGLIAATTSLFGESELGARAGSLLLHPAIALVLYALARRLFDPRVAFWSSLTYFLMPSVALSSQIITTDVPLMLFWAIGMWAAAAALADNRWRHWLVLGLVTGLGLLSKYTMIAFGLSFLLYLLCTAQHRRQLLNPRLYVAVFVALLVFAPNLLWNVTNDFPTIRHTASISHLGQNADGMALNPDKLLDFVGEQFLMAGPVFFGALLVGVVTLRRQWSDPSRRFLACFTLPLLGGICLQALLAKANGNWAAPAYLAGALWATVLLLQINRQRLLMVALSINVAIGAAVLHFDQVMDWLNIPLKKGNDPFWAMRDWETTGKFVSGVRAEFPEARLLFDQRDMMAQMLFYTTPHPLDAVMWNGDSDIDNHYELTTRLDAATLQWLYVTRGSAVPEALVERFHRVQQVKSFATVTSDGQTAEYNVFLLQQPRGGY